VLETALVAAWARQVSWIPGATFHRLGGVVVALTGLPDQTQQVALAERDPSDPAAAVAAVGARFRDAGWRPAFDLVAGAHPALESALGAAGYRVAGRRPVLSLALAPAPVARPARSGGVAVRPARPGDLDTLVELHQRVFGLSAPVAGGLLGPGALRAPGLVVLVAELGGRPVGSTLVHLDRPAAGLVGLGVVRRARRRGVGRALTLAAAHAAADAGARWLWLQSTPDGEHLYRAVGFTEVATSEIWLAV
jgi:ribosomal protein S18 acetylase RimI-like enzyme